MRYFFGFIALSCMSWGVPLWAQIGATDLLTILVEDTTAQITQVDIERKAVSNVYDALRGVPGVNLNISNAKNESYITIRGGGREQVGMYIDDVPTATVYWSEFDLANYLTFDLYSIDVSKGYSSSLLPSSNGLSGVVNIRTSKPTKPLEFRAKLTSAFDRVFDHQGWSAGLSIGTRQEKFYLQLQLINVEQDFYTLSRKFRPTKYEDGGRRDNSDYENRRINFIVGYTPTENIDIMLGVVNQRYKKGQPFDAVTDADPNQSNPWGWPRFYRWPSYKTDRYYINGSFKLSEQANLKLVAYYDKHVDTLHAFKDNHLIDTWLLSTYKEYGAGGQAIFDYEIDDRNKFSLSASYRKTSHRGYDQNGGVGPFLPTDDYIFDYIDFGGEYTFKPVEPLAIVVGASYSIMEPKRGLTGQVPQTGSIMDGHNLFSYQIGFFYDINTEHQLFFTYARKNRTPSMQQMFSRDDNGQPNGLHLSPERADHFELGYRGHPLDWLKFSGSLFYSAYTDRITWSGSRSLVNLAKVNSHGLELELEATINDYLSGGFSFSYLDVKTKGVSRENSLVTGSPEYTSSAYLIISPIEGLSIIPQAYMRSSFYNEPDPDDPNVNGSGFAVVDLTAKYEFKEHYSVEVGVKNVFDKYYYNSMDSPLPGRNFFLGLNVKY